MTANFSEPTQDQVKLCIESGIDPQGMSVRTEDEAILVLLHHKSRNTVMICKGEKARREYGNRRKSAG